MEDAGPGISDLLYLDATTGGRRKLDPRLLGALPWRKIAQFIEAVGSERTLSGFVSTALHAMERIVPFDYAFSIVIDKEDVSHPPLFHQIHAPAGVLRDYFGHYIAVDPYLPLVPSTPRGAIDWNRLDAEFTTDFLFRYDTRHSISLTSEGVSASASYVSVLHRGGRAGFDDREKAAYFVLRPHLGNLFGLLTGPESARKHGLHAAALRCGLTDRERQVADLLCDRLSAREIAKRLRIGRRTVEKHIEHVYMKTNVRSRSNLRDRMLLLAALGEPGEG